MRMKDKNRFKLDVVRLLLSLACLVLGIAVLWANDRKPEENGNVPEETKQEEKAPEIVTIVVSEELVPDEEDQTALPGGIIIAAGEPAEVQPIQEAPKEAEEPKDPPALVEGTDLTDPDKVPEYEEDPKPAEKPDDTVVSRPPQDDGHPGQIYIEGFGWIDHGGPNVSIDANDMYMNGNHIGDM